MREGALLRIDLNCDAGESYGNWTMGDDDAMFGLVFSVNTACGGHAGETRTMTRSLSLAAENGLGIGAHLSFEDKLNFGQRRIPLSALGSERMVARQVGGCTAVAELQGQKLNHATPRRHVGLPAIRGDAGYSAFVKLLRRKQLKWITCCQAGRGQ